jgi:hypothetical protein
MAPIAIMPLLVEAGIDNPVQDRPLLAMNSQALEAWCQGLSIKLHDQFFIKILLSDYIF